MIKRFFNILFLFSFGFGFFSCHDDSHLNPGSIEMPMEGKIPVEFLFFEPDGDATRASETVKLKFQEGDVIHISATFTGSEGQLGKSYGAMKLMGGKWVAADGSSLIWPFVATKGSFKAFYVPQCNGVLLPNSTSDAILLAELDASFNKNGDWDLDPLEAKSIEYKYGHAVEFHFTHSLSHLTFKNLETGISDFFWLEKTGTEGISNAYRLKLDENNDISLVYECNSSAMYGENKPYLSSKATIYNHDENGSTSLRVKTSFFLAPGDYSNIELRTNNNIPYLSLKSDETSDLLPNTPYIIDVMKSNGVTFIIKDDEKWYDEEEEYEVSVKEFIEAAVNGTSYTLEVSEDKEIVIIEPIPNGARLVRNVRFPEEQKDYDRIWTANSRFTPNIPPGRVFEGDHHYISYLKYPLFQYNSGTIQNLGLKETVCEVQSKYTGPENDYKTDRSRRGGLCQWNRASGTIYNVRIENLSLTVNVDESTSIRTHSAGVVCGVNLGTIRDVYLGGNISVIIQNDKKTPEMNSEIALGGIVGQNTGTINRILPLEGSNFEITVQNKCTGNAGVFSVGGAVGFNGGVLQNISLPAVNIDCSLSDGYQGYTGGLAGRLRGSSTTNLVEGCSVAGNLMSGEMSGFAEMSDSYLYTGGLAGSCAGFIVKDCSSVFSVDSSVKEVNSNSRYATGGVFGAILAIDGEDTNKIYNLTGWNAELNGDHDGTSAFMGSFAGIVPQGKDWNFYSQKGITVRNFDGMSEIGTSMNIDAGDSPSEN